MTKTRKMLVGALAGLLLAFGWVMCQLEAECFWNPWIDTHCTPGYSEELFTSISVGMPLSEVESLMPAPLEVWTNAEGIVSMWYTRDGKCRFGDFAWQSRTISVTTGIVTEVIAITVGD